MTSQNNFSTDDWKMLADAPEWVYVAMSNADGKEAAVTNLKESRHFKRALEDYKAKSALVRDVIADDTKAGKEVRRATASDAEDALKKINSILDNQVSEAEADAFRDFLMSLGSSVAEAAGEKMLGIGDNVSKKEAEMLERVGNALKATEAHKQTREAAEARKEAAAKAAEKRRRLEAEEKLLADARAKRAAEKEAREKAAAERAAKAKAEAEAKAKAEREEQARIKREEAAAKIEAARKAAEEKEKARQAKIAADAAAVAAAEAANPYMGEHTVVSGDNLSYISKKFYGTPNHWKKIYEANKETIGDNPSLIRVGQVFKIPKLS